MPVEPYTPPQPNTWKSYVYTLTAPLAEFSAYWGRRLVQGSIGLVADVVSEALMQSFYSHLPGHSEQAPDSATQTGQDRGLFQFSGESTAAFQLRQQQAWFDYGQSGTWQQVIKVVNQWGNAGWPSTWVNLASSNLVESGSPTVWTFTLTIPYGNIVPEWTPVTYGSGQTYGEPGFYYGIGPSTDISTLLYLVRKWKRSASRGFVKVYYSASGFVTFTV